MELYKDGPDRDVGHVTPDFHHVSAAKLGQIPFA